MTAVQVMANVMILDGYTIYQVEILTLLAFTLTLTFFEVKHLRRNGKRSTLALIVMFLTFRQAMIFRNPEDLTLPFVRSAAYSIPILYVYFKLYANFFRLC